MCNLAQAKISCSSQPEVLPLCFNELKQCMGGTYRYMDERLCVHFQKSNIFIINDNQF